MSKEIFNEKYSNLKFEPIEYFISNATDEEIIGACKLNILKYLTRENDNKYKDYCKMRYYTELMINTIEKK